MLRRKEIAGSPRRDSIETSDVIAALIRESLQAAPAITSASVDATLASATPAIRMLIAAGHLDSTPITLLAGGTTCEIFTVSGKKALSHEESLNPIVGMTSANSYTLYLPAGVLGPVVEAAAAADPHISVGKLETAVGELAAEANRAERPRSLVDLAVLRNEVKSR